LVSTVWLAERLGSSGLVVLDGSWYLPTAARDPEKEFLVGHIPGARFFDLDRTSDPDTPLPHMLPTAEQFTRQMRALGIRRDQAIVVYDGSGANLSAARVWWMFRAFGHSMVAVLDGGFGKWVKERRPVETGASPPAAPGDFEARLDPHVVRDLAQVRANLESRREQLVDMRPAGRFAGRDAEPRPGIRSGHVPGSLSLPYADLVSGDGTLLPPVQLKGRLEKAGLDLARPVVATCGSGTSACALILGLETLGLHAHALYDGAWTEWGGRADTPVETG
jgi:thiosulfate/3-mercaptopyruvate sulfurtransferase